MKLLSFFKAHHILRIAEATLVCPEFLFAVIQGILWFPYVWRYFDVGDVNLEGPLPTINSRKHGSRDWNGRG